MSRAPPREDAPLPILLSNRRPRRRRWPAAKRRLLATRPCCACCRASWSCPRRPRPHDVLPRAPVQPAFMRSDLQRNCRIAKISDDPGVANLGHHACHHVVEIGSRRAHCGNRVRSGRPHSAAAERTRGRSLHFVELHDLTEYCVSGALRSAGVALPKDRRPEMLRIMNKPHGGEHAPSTG